MKSIRQAAGRIDSFEDLELVLADLLSSRMEPTAFASMLESCMAQAAGYGAAAVNAEAEDADS